MAKIVLIIEDVPEYGGVSVSVDKARSDLEDTEDGQAAILVQSLIDTVRLLGTEVEAVPDKDIPDNVVPFPTDGRKEH